MKIKDVLNIRPDPDAPNGYRVELKIPGREVRRIPAPHCHDIRKATAFVAELFS